MTSLAHYLSNPPLRFKLRAVSFQTYRFGHETMIYCLITSRDLSPCSIRIGLADIPRCSTMEAALNITPSPNPNGTESVGQNFDEVELWLRVVHGVVMSLFLVCSFTGNLIVVLLVATHKKLRYGAIVVCLGVVVADLLVGLTWTLQSLAGTIAGEWPFGQVACTVMGILWVWVLYARWLEIAVVSLDRFFTITFIFSYSKFNKPLMIILTILAWVLPALLRVVPGILTFGEYKFTLIFTTCSINCLDIPDCGSFYVGLYTSFLVIGGILPTILYTIMYCIGRRKRAVMNYRLGTIQVSDSSVTQNGHEPTSSMETSEDTSNGTQNRTPVRRNRTDTLQDRDRRALVTIAILFVSLLVTQIPLVVLTWFAQRPEIYQKIPLHVHFVVTYIFLISTILDPIVIMKNKDFKDAIAHVWKRWRSTNLRPQLSHQNGSTCVSVRVDTSVNFTIIDTTPTSPEVLNRDSTEQIDG